ncbi:MAG: hypothetical protein Q9199_002262 [Rusavskia elegans]
MALRRSLSSVMRRSGLASPGISPTRPVTGSPKKRRRFLRETEDESGSMSIEDYNYRGDSYHSSNLATKYPLPLLCEPPDTTLQARLSNMTGIERHIRHLLDTHEVPFLNFDFQTFSKPGYPADGDIKRPGLLVWVDIKDAVSAASLSAARRDISDLLEQNGLGHGSPYNLVQERSRATAGHCKDRIPRLWISLGLFYVGSSFGGAVPTVALTVNPYAVHDWQTLSLKLHTAINKARFADGVRLEVEIFPGHRGDLEERPAKDFSETFTPAPRMGASIGVVGESGGGTLGGFLRLKVGDIVHEGFLTNSHVVAPPDTAPPEVHERFAKHGVNWKTSYDEEERCWVQYLALKDNDETRDSCLVKFQDRAGHTEVVENYRSYHEGLIANETSTIAEMEALGKDASYRRRLKQEYERQMADYWLKYKHLDTMPIFLGKTLLASGKAVVGNKRKIMDWAFVTCSGMTRPINNVSHNLFNPAVENKLPTSAAMREMGLSPENYFSSNTMLYLPPPNGQPPKEPGKIKPDRWYFKHGRTTGITAGICNGIESYIFMGDTRYAHNRQGDIERIINPDPNAKPEDLEYSEEWIIINAHSSNRSFTNQQTFCDRGDSGSFIWDAQGRLCGLLFGDVHGWCGPKIPADGNPNGQTPRPLFSRPDEHKGGRYQGAGIVSDINDVIADIVLRAAQPYRLYSFLRIP